MYRQGGLYSSLCNCSRTRVQHACEFVKTQKSVHAPRSFLQQFLADMGWSVADVDLLVPHQASLPAIRLLSARLGFTEVQTFINIGQRGNCIGASLPLALAEAVASGRLRRGMRVLLAGTAAGLMIGAAGLVF
jgi:3-oxoacyl-[acyl-carrier-protein] synthase III